MMTAADVWLTLAVTSLGGEILHIQLSLAGSGGGACGAFVGTSDTDLMRIPPSESGHQI